MQDPDEPPAKLSSRWSLGIGGHFLLAFLLALLVYLVFYSIDHHLRVRHGPWIVTFTTESNQAPALVIRQNYLGIEGVKIIFRGEQSPGAPLPRTVVFDSPLKAAPFGRLKFHDLTFLPGTLTFDCFGHEIELIPRTLFIDKRKYPWRPAMTIALSRTNAPEMLPLP